MSGPNSTAVAAAIDVDNSLFAHYLLIALVGILVSVGVYRLVIGSLLYIRTLTCLNNDEQRFFKIPTKPFAWIKRHVLYAPLFNRRHSKQMRIGPVEMGILPTRFQSLLLVGIITTNIFLCAYGIEWHGPIITLLKHLGHRTGTFAVVNMIPLVIMAARNNPLIGFLRISYDTFNLMHRWFGRLVVSLTITHSVVCIIVIVINKKKMHIPGWEAFTSTLKEVRFIAFGFIGTIAMLIIILQAWTALRHAFYETFLHIHIALVSVVLAASWVHLDGFPQLIYIKAVVSIWVIERGIRLFSLIYRNVGRRGTTAVIELLPGEAVRISLCLARPFTFRPGQHVFLTIPSVGFWTNHPFSVAWSEAASPHRIDSERCNPPDVTTDSLSAPQTNLFLIIRRRSGFTDSLYRKVLENLNGRLSLPAFVEGPYHGASHTLHSYGTVMMFAGGVGITHQVPFVRELVAGFASGTVAARRIILIWVIQSPEHLEWIRPWMTTILAMPQRRDVLSIKLFVTRPRSTKEIHSPSATVQMFPGKPNVDALVEMASRDQVGAMGVSVCGPGGFGDDVRAAARRRQGARNIDFLEESFGW